MIVLNPAIMEAVIQSKSDENSDVSACRFSDLHYTKTESFKDPPLSRLVRRQFERSVWFAISCKWMSVVDAVKLLEVDHSHKSSHETTTGGMKVELHTSKSPLACLVGGDVDASSARKYNNAASSSLLRYKGKDSIMRPPKNKNSSEKIRISVLLNSDSDSENSSDASNSENENVNEKSTKSVAKKNKSKDKDSKHDNLKMDEDETIQQSEKVKKKKKEKAKFTSPPPKKREKQSEKGNFKRKRESHSDSDPESEVNKNNSDAAESSSSSNSDSD